MAKPTTVTSYRWDDASSIVQRVDVRTQGNGWSVAYLYADPAKSEHAARLDLRAIIRLKGWGTLSDHRNGEFALRVTGLRSPQELIDMLGSEGFVAGTPAIASNAVRLNEAPTTLWQKAKANSLQWSGILATIGNSMSFLSGVHRGYEPGQMAQGLLFGIADLPLAIAGERDDPRQLNNLLRNLKKHYEKEGIQVPRTASIYVETSDKGKGFRELAKDYLHRYANQIKCGMEVLAAAATIRAGRNQNSSFKKTAPYIWGPGFLASLLIPERKIDEEKYAQAGPLGRLWMKIQSNPLSIGGTLGYANVIANYGSATAERKRSLGEGGDGRRFYRWDFAIPTVMVGANGLYAMSKKTVGGDIKNDAIVSDAYTIAAQIINKQPDELRDNVIESTARFFAQRSEIKEHYPAVVKRLREEVEIQRRNPWFEPRGLASYIPMAKHGRLREEAGDGMRGAHEQPATAPTAPAPASRIQLDGATHIASMRQPQTTLEIAK